MALIDVFFDADAIIAGSASKTGAASVLLQLAEFKLINGITSEKVIEECQRNISQKLPDAIGVFNEIITNSLTIIENASGEACQSYKGMADDNDLIILTTAINFETKYFVTFNVKHFYPSTDVDIIIVKPSELIHIIRKKLSEF